MSHKLTLRVHSDAVTVIWIGHDLDGADHSKFSSRLRLLFPTKSAMVGRELVFVGIIAGFSRGRTINRSLRIYRWSERNNMKRKNPTYGEVRSYRFVKGITSNLWTKNCYWIRVQGFCYRLTNFTVIPRMWTICCCFFRWLVDLGQGINPIKYVVLKHHKIM